MPVDITPFSQKFFNQFKNGVNFTDNPSDFTTNLAGSVMENIRYVQEIDVSWKFTASAGNSVGSSPQGGGIYRISRSTGDWSNDGFAVGDTFYMTYVDAGGSQSADGTITSLSGSIMVATGSLPDSSINGFLNASVSITGTSDLTASVFKYGLLDNNESFNVESKVSGNDQGYYGGNIGFDTGGGVRDINFVTLQRLGQYKDWDTGSVRVRFVSNPLTAGGFNLSQRFEIEHTFMITPYYLDGELSNLQDNIIPDILNGLNSLKYAYSPGFRNVLSNPNTEKAVIENSNNLGSVAWFNENFNGFQNNFNIESITYEDEASGASADGILVSSKTKIRIVVSKDVGSFSGTERYGAYISYLPEESEYQDTVLTDLKDNFLYDNSIGNAGIGSVTGQDFITDSFAAVVSGELIILLEVEYSLAQKVFLSNKISQAPIYFLIGIEVGDVTLSNGNSDRVILLADANEYDKSPDIEGLMDVTKFDIYPHDRQIGVGAASTDMTSWNESGLVVDFDFDLDLNKDAVINTLELKLLAENPSTGNIFELDSYTYQIGGSIISGGIQQLSIATTRGYILDIGDQFNDVTIGVGANAAGIQTYNGRFAQKISWQDWIENLDVDTIFYDAGEPNDNFNDKSSNYSALNGYDIKFGISANLYGTNDFGTSGFTDYLVLSPALTVHDYEEDGNITPVWSHVIETFNPVTTSSLGVSVLTGQDTLFRSTWTNSGGAVASLVGIEWGINRIEETNQLGYQITEMSSINAPAAGQMLIPSVGTLLDMYIDSGNVVMECLIDGSIAQSGLNYNLSTEIRGIATMIEGKITSPLGELKDTSGTVETKVEAP